MRKRNPTKKQIADAAKRIAKSAGRTAWRATKFTGRVAGRSAASAARTAASEVKQSICRPRAKNPASTYKEFPVQMGTSIKNLKTVWIARTQEDAIHVAKVYAKAYPNNVIRVP